MLPRHLLCLFPPTPNTQPHLAIHLCYPRSGRRDTWTARLFYMCVYLFGTTGDAFVCVWNVDYENIDTATTYISAEYLGQRMQQKLQ